MDITLAGIALPTDGVYSVLVQVPSAQSSSSGNYALTAWDATVHDLQANLNQTEYGQINSPFDTDQWTFSAQANTQIQFDLLVTASPYIEFGLSGPNGFTGFSGLSSSSDLITLTASGTYVLTTTTSRVVTGNYTFLLAQTSQTELTLNIPYQDTLIGSGQAQLFAFSNPSIQQILITLQDSSTADQNEVYVKRDAAPTRSDFQYRFSTTGASQQVLVPSASCPGPWYVLVYSDAVAAAPTTCTLTASGASIDLFSMTPDHYGNTADATLTLNGSGFNSSTSLSLISADGTVYPVTTLEVDSPTRMNATLTAGTIPVGIYTVRVISARRRRGPTAQRLHDGPGRRGRADDKPDCSEPDRQRSRRDHLRPVSQHRATSPCPRRCWS